MTVADNTSRNQYTATSGQTVFAYTFEIVDKGDIVVLKNGTILSEGTNYTVSNVGNDSGGNVTLTVGATAGDILTLYRDMPYARTQNYTNSGDFLASEVNSDFDNLWLAGEQTNRSFSQSIRKPITDSDSISMELPAAASRTNSFLTFDSTGAVSTSPLSSALSPSIIARQQFTGNGSTTVFTLAANPGSAAAVVIYIDGVYQEEGTYSVSGTALTFTEAPPTNASIEVVSYKTTAVGTTDANSVTYTPAGTGAVQTTVQTKLRESVSVKDFGAVGDGVTDDTAAIQAAQNYCSGAGGELFFPIGSYLVTSELSFPSSYSVRGAGSETKFILDLSSGEYLFKEATNARYRWELSNFRVQIKSGAESNVGVAYCDYSLRGGLIHRIWTEDLKTPIYLGTRTYGTVSIKDICLLKSTAESPTGTGISINGSIVMLDNIEILGSFEYGIKANGSGSYRVLKLNGFNIAGSSTGVSEMKYAVYVENFDVGYIRCGYIEKLDSSISNGVNQAITLKNSSNFTVENNHLATGSVYLDGGNKNSVSEINYTESLGGIKLINNAKAVAKTSALKYAAAGYGNGFLYLTDVPRAATGLLSNPTLTSAGADPFLVYGGGTTKANDGTVFESGSNSKLITANQYNGVTLSETVIANRVYTVVARVRLGTATLVDMQAGTSTSRDGDHLFLDAFDTSSEWGTLIFSGSSSTTTFQVKIRNNSAVSGGTFYIDSVQIYPGVNHFSPELYG